MGLRLTFASLTSCIGASDYRQYDCLGLCAGFRTVGTDSDLDAMVGRRRHFSRLLHVPAFCHVRHFRLCFPKLSLPRHLSQLNAEASAIQQLLIEHAECIFTAHHLFKP
jgi:hypothetical protein